MADSAVSVTMFSFEQVLVLSLDLKLLMLTGSSRARMAWRSCDDLPALASSYGL